MDIYHANFDSNMANVSFSKPAVVTSQPWIEICRRNLVCL